MACNFHSHRVKISSNPTIVFYTLYHDYDRLRNQFYYRSKTTYKKLNIEVSQNRDHKLSLRICRTTWTTTTTTNNNHNDRLIHNEKENKQEKTKHRTVKQPWRVCTCQFSRQAVYGKARSKYIFDRLRVSRSSKIFERANTDRGLSELFPTIHATIEQR